MSNEQYPIQIPIELKDRLTAEFDRLAASVKGKEAQIRQSMEAIKSTSAEAQAQMVAQISKTTALYREGEREKAAQAQAALRAAEKQAEQLARIQAKSESDYQRVNAQAAAAEANMLKDRFDRKIALEHVQHAKSLESLVGNDEAQEAEVRRHNAVMNRLQKEQSEAKVSSFLGSAGSFATGIIGANLAMELLQVPRQAVEAALAMQTFRQTIDFASGSAEQGAKNFQFLLMQARTLGISLADTAPQFAAMAAAAKGTALEGKGVQDIFHAMSEAAVTLHLDANQTSRAFYALQEMMSMGTVQTRQMRMVALALPGAFQDAAKAMGTTTAGLMKMMEQGKVMTDDFIPKLAAAMHEKYEKSAVDASDNARQSIQKFKNSVFETSATVGGTFVKILGDLSRAYLYVADSIDKVNAAQQRDFEKQRLLEMTPAMRAAEARKKLAQEEASRFASAQDALDRMREKGEADAEVQRTADQKKEAERRVALLKEFDQEYIRIKEDASKAAAAIDADDLEALKAREAASYSARVESFKTKYGEISTATKEYHDALVSMATAEKDKLTAISEAYYGKLEADRQKDLAAATKTANEKAMADANAVVQAQANYDKAMESLRKTDPNAALGDTGLQQSKYQSELQQIKAHFAEIQDATNEHYQRLLLYATENGQNTADIEQEYADKNLEIQRKQNAAKEALDAQSALSSLSRITGTLAGALKAYKTFGTAYKAFAISQAIIDTLVTETGIIKSMAGTGPWGYALGVAEAIAAGVAGFARVNEIRAQKFEFGGPVNGPRHSQGGVNANLEGGEFIFSRRDVQNMGGAGALEAMRQQAADGQTTIHNIFAPQNTFHGGAGGFAPVLDELKRQPAEFGRIIRDNRLKGYQTRQPVGAR